MASCSLLFGPLQRSLACGVLLGLGRVAVVVCGPCRRPRISRTKRAAGTLGAASAVNIYTYVGGNPLSYIDPLGLANANPSNNPGGAFYGSGGNAGGGYSGGGIGGGGRYCPPTRIDVDSRGNAFPLKHGEYITGSKDGIWKQVRDPQGNPTGMRMDGPHSPNTHTDPRALQPHSHVPGVTNSDGTPWLEVK